MKRAITISAMKSWTILTCPKNGNGIIKNLRHNNPMALQGGDLNRFTVPDNHSVAIVSSHLGRLLFDITPNRYQIHDT